MRKKTVCLSVCLTSLKMPTHATKVYNLVVVVVVVVYPVSGKNSEEKKCFFPFSLYFPKKFWFCSFPLSSTAMLLLFSRFLVATKHLYIWLCPSVGWLVGWSGNEFVSRSTRRTYWPTWPCFFFLFPFLSFRFPLVHHNFILMAQNNL